MGLRIETVSLWHGNERAEGAIRAALERAGKACRPTESWAVSVYQGPEIENGGTRVRLSGTICRECLSSDWLPEEADGGFAYNRVFNLAMHADDLTWVEDQVEGPVRVFLSLA